MKPEYCTQNEGKCLTCSLSNYGLDCNNNKFFALQDCADSVTGGNLAMMAKLVNDSGGNLDEVNPVPADVVYKEELITLYSMRSGDSIGRRLERILKP